MRKRWGTGCLVALFVVLGGPMQAARAACPAWGTELQPADGKTLLITGQFKSAIDDYVNETGDTPGGMMIYTGIAAPTLGTLTPNGSGGTEQDMQYLMQHYPNSSMQVGLNFGANTLAAVGLGGYDSQIIALANVLKNAARPIYLRIGYEFDGAHNKYEPADYVKAFKRIVEKLRNQGANNVSFVWHAVNAPHYNGHALTEWYPGDCYVDWAAVSIFGQGFGTSMPYATELANFARSKDIPLMIAESTPAYHNTSEGSALWNSWYTNVVNWVVANNVKVWSYINQDWGLTPQFATWGNSQVQDNASIKASWLTEVGKPRYLHASPALFCTELHYC